MYVAQHPVIYFFDETMKFNPRDLTSTKQTFLSECSFSFWAHLTLT